MKKRCIMCYSAKTQQDGRFFCAECDDSFSQIEILLDNVASLKDSFPSPPMAENRLFPRPSNQFGRKAADPQKTHEVIEIIDDDNENLSAALNNLTIRPHEKKNVTHSLARNKIPISQPKDFKGRNQHDNTLLLKSKQNIQNNRAPSSEENPFEAISSDSDTPFKIPGNKSNVNFASQKALKANMLDKLTEVNKDQYVPHMDAVASPRIANFSQSNQNEPEISHQESSENDSQKNEDSRNCVSEERNLSGHERSKKSQEVEIFDFIIVLGDENESAIGNLIKNREGYEVHGPMAAQFREMEKGSFFVDEKQEVRVGENYQAKIPSCVRGSPPTKRRYKLKLDPSILKPEILYALENGLKEKFLLQGFKTESLIEWLQELNYDIPKLYYSIAQNREKAKQRLIASKVKERIHTTQQLSNGL